MSKKKKSANFDFVKKIDVTQYDRLIEIEKEINVDYSKCRNSIRTVFEWLLNKVIEDEGLNDRYNKYLSDLKQKRSLHNSIKFIEKEAPTLLPTKETVKVRYKNKKGKRKEVNDKMMYFIKEYGNSGSHAMQLKEEPNEWVPVINYQNTVSALKSLHYLCKFYFNNKPSFNDVDIADFDENLLMIDDYSIEKSYVPEDHDETMCIREYAGYKLNDKGEIDVYTIIRKYPLEKIDNTYLDREYKIHDLIVRRFIQHAKQIPNIEKIGNQDNRDLHYNFVLIAYSFYYEPISIDDEMLGKLSFDQRLDICKKVIDYFSVFHNEKEKICHRMFNYNCVKLCKYEDEYIPFIIKLNFAKIESSPKTVILYAENAKKNLSKLQVEKYLPYEWNQVAADPDPQWDKVDIYSLGVFVYDMLMGKISSNRPNEANMKGKIPEKIIELILEMTDEDIYVRPDCRSALEVLNNVSYQL